MKRKKIIFIITAVMVLTYGEISYAQSHLKMAVDCQTCHSCEAPTKSDPCLVACPRHEMMTVHQLPGNSPATITLDKLKNIENLYEPVIFSHRVHAEMSGMSGGCAMCHHYNPPGNILPCNDCHDPSRIRADISKPDLKGAFHRQCIDCHREWNSNVQCADCHELLTSGKSAFAKTEEIKDRVHPAIEVPAKIIYDTPSYEGKIVTFLHNEHNKLYGFECIDCHQNESCAQCHTSYEQSVNEDIIFAVKHQKCEDCHDTQNDCLTCHRNEELKPFNHSNRTGFALSKFHVNLGCIQCHQTNKVFTGLNKQCVSCHNDWSPESFNHSVTGLILSESHIEFDCESCHEESRFVKQPVCSMCHDEDITYPDFEPGERL